MKQLDLRPVKSAYALHCEIYDKLGDLAVHIENVRQKGDCDEYFLYAQTLAGMRASLRNAWGNTLDSAYHAEINSE